MDYFETFLMTVLLRLHILDFKPIYCVQNHLTKNKVVTSGVDANFKTTDIKLKTLFLYLLALTAKVRVTWEPSQNTFAVRVGPNVNG